MVMDVMVIDINNLKPDVRLLGQDDIHEAVRIEIASFEFPWTGSEFLEYVGSADKRGYTAKVGSAVVGYIAFEPIVHRQYVRIRNIAVDPHCRRIGIARYLIEYVREEYELNDRYKYLVATVRETNLDAQLFFKSVKFKCTKIIYDYYLGEGYTEPAYLMKRLLNDVSHAPPSTRPTP
jgi:[ribosomal protein S18]-alanine N-acetyltransferase